MGSLERVQYKFASIIGELCSEPIVLSQFAVWLDLKLAEYKAKGSISLDCSGEKPEPPWMKGVLPSSPPSSLFEHKNAEDEIHSPRPSFRNTAHSSQRQFPSSSRADHSPTVTSPSQTFSADALSERLASDDVVLIKDEPMEGSAGVFPTNVFHNEGSTGGEGFNDARKRPGTSDTSNFSPHRPPFTTKVRRVANASASGSPSSASNQSVSGVVRDSPSHDPSGSMSDDPVILPSSSSQRTDSTSQSSWLGQVTAERDADTSGSDAVKPQEGGMGLGMGGADWLALSSGPPRHPDPPAPGVSGPRRTEHRDDRVCRVCGVVFTRKSSCLAHYKTKHTSTGPTYRCHCGRTYQWRRSFSRHRSTCFHRPR